MVTRLAWVQTLPLTFLRNFVDGPTTPGAALPRPGFGLRRVRSPLLALSLVCFLFLRVLRCFSSPGSPLPYGRCRNRFRRVAPFGNPRINGYLPLRAAYRSLSRPSSPPRAKASFMRPSLLSFNVAELGFTLASSSPAASYGGSEARELFLSYCEILSFFCLLPDSSGFRPFARFELPVCQCAPFFE